MHIHIQSQIQSKINACVKIEFLADYKLFDMCQS